MQKIVLVTVMFISAICSYTQPDAKRIKKLDSIFSSFNKTTPGVIIKRPTIADTKIIPEREYTFLIKIEEFARREAPTNGWIRFHSNNNGEVTRLTVSHPRLMHHRFDKIKDQ